MTSLPYRSPKGQQSNLDEISLDSLPSSRPPPPERNTSTSSATDPPPAHFVHNHHTNDPHYFQGINPGNYDSQDHPHAENIRAEPVDSSASGTSSHKPGWSQYDTLVDRNRNPANLDSSEPHQELSEKFQPPQARFNAMHSRAASLASTAEDSDDFDWDTSSGDDDEDDEKEDLKIRAKRGRRIYLTCMRLARPVRILLLAIVGTAICLIPFIVTVSLYSGKPAFAQVEVWSIWIAIIWAASCGTFIVVDWIPPLLIRLIVAVYGKAPEIYKTYVEAIVASSLWFKLTLCITWAWISLGGVLAIRYSGPATRPAYFRTVFQLLRSLFASSVVLLFEKIALQLVAINFHKVAVKDRLGQNQKALKALGKLNESKYLRERATNKRFNPTRALPDLFGAHTAAGYASKASRDGLGGHSPPVAQVEAQKDHREKNHGRSPSLPFRPHHHRDHHNRSTSESPSEYEKQKKERKANLASQISEVIATATLKDSKLFKSRAESQHSARKLAKLLFTNLSDHKKTLAAEDFIPYFKTEDEAREAFAIFDADKNGDISKREMREAVQRIFRERRALSTSLKDMSSAISKLDGVLLFLAFIVIVFIWLLIFDGDSTVANIVPLSTFVVGFSFVFGNSAKNIFESMIFIFSTHPYDVGDLVCIDEDWMFVKEFGLLSTTFRTTVNQEVIAPNALLASSKYIYNSRRSGAQWEVTLIQVSFDTLLETIDTLRSRLRAWVKENDRDFGGPLDINFNEISQQNYIELAIAFEHKGNWQDWGARWSRRTKLMRQLKTLLEELGIRYELPPQPVTFEPKSGAAPFKLGARRVSSELETRI